MPGGTAPIGKMACSIARFFRLDPTDTQKQELVVLAGGRFQRSRVQALRDERLGIMRSNGPDAIAAMADFHDSLDAAPQQRVRKHLQRRRSSWRRPC